ncbi:sucrase ferredoxin [Pelagibacterium halotolerans]|uniref:sucrase ferredoxin n=1 Tax=Pelagibacterium halotolerans TaxID=531813 RepID=UPI00385078CA
MTKHVFCRDLCLERGEPHEGTGNAPTRVLLLAWPRGKWRTPRWESADMSAPLAKAVHEAALAGVHVALVDKVGETENLPQLQAQPESVFADFESEAELIAAIGNYVDGTVFEGTYDPRTTILVCTDSRRDACCARYGFSTYKALTAIADPEQFNIVQATHLGGCRFAASLVVVPQRQRYGRMTAGQAPAFLEALSRGEIFLPAYKGRTDMPEPLQVAELAALRWAETNTRSSGPVRLDSPDLPKDPQEGAELTVHAAVHGTELDISLRARLFHVQGNCGVVAEGGGQHTLRWCLDGVTTTQSQPQY